MTERRNYTKRIKNKRVYYDPFIFYLKVVVLKNMVEKKIDLNNVINFVNLLNKFRQVERVIRVNGGDRLENDVEHSYQLAMLSWYIISTNKLDLDLDLVLKYSLIHDLVEVYAGDTFIYTKDKEHRDSKEKRELDSLIKIEVEIPEFPIFDLIKTYEKKEDKESRFVYALDKIEPVLIIYTNQGRTWKEKDITIEMLVEHKKEKVAQAPELIEFFDEIIKLLKKEESELFPKQQSIGI